MEIKIKLLSKAFLFIDNFGLTKSDGEKVLDLTNRSDSFIKTVITNLAYGISEADVDWKDLISLIKDSNIRKDVEDQLGVNVSIFSDTIDAVTEVLEIVTEEVIEETEEEQEEVPMQDTLPEENKIPEMNLADLLEGTTKIVSRRLLNADLSDEDKATLLSLETQGKDRVAVKSLLN